MATPVNEMDAAVPLHTGGGFTGCTIGVGFTVTVRLKGAPGQTGFVPDKGVIW